jgi:hypothetical protein
MEGGAILKRYCFPLAQNARKALRPRSEEGFCSKDTYASVEPANPYPASTRISKKNRKKYGPNAPQKKVNLGIRRGEYVVSASNFGNMHGCLRDFRH